MSETLELSPVDAESSLRVALLIGSDVITHGLEAILNQITDVRSVMRADLRSLPRLIEGDQIDVLVVSFDLWFSLEGSCDPTAHRTKILVIGNDLHTREIKSSVLSPWTGSSRLRTSRRSVSVTVSVDWRRAKFPCPPN